MHPVFWDGYHYFPNQEVNTVGLYVDVSKDRFKLQPMILQDPPVYSGTQHINCVKLYIYIFLSQLEKYQDVIKATEEFETKLVSLGIENFFKQLVFFSLYAQLGIFIKIKIIGSDSFSFALIFWFVTQIFCCHLGLVPEGTNNLTSHVKDVGIHFGNKKVYSITCALSF